MADRELSQNIINHLRNNSRTTLARMARKERVSISTIYTHVKQLEDTIIDKHTSIPDYARLGYPFRTEFYCDHEHPKTIATTLRQHQNANTISLLDDNKISIDTIFATLQEKERFKEQLEERGCTNIQAHDVLAPVLIEGWNMQE
ncbi:winged helix-turn-helix transcriptional regulator [Candidatus Woesearchaeota archaeon]|nr:winged helix-turn-helix transcriptional regulator [Candidatus Woesearchaeota archaeon]